MTDTKHWITKLVPSLAFAAGIIMASVGGIMITSSSIKLAFFETEPYSYYAPDECVYDYSRKPSEPSIDTEKPYRLSPDEVISCKEEKEATAKKQFQNSKKENIIDGLSSLLVGAILIFAFRRRK